MRPEEKSSATDPVARANAERKFATANSSGGGRDAYATSEQVAGIVEQALECDPAQRAQFLDEACGNDAALRAEVDSLLGFQEEARDFIETPAYEAVSHVLARTDGELKPNQILGDYKVLSLLGEGGMGEVYLVEDTKLERQVAIKVVKRGLGSAGVLRHSRKEEKILAGLNHPNIARLYGAEGTPSGLPYFVMEYVDGRRLDHYCREENLSIQDRLALFRKICAAVTYAHQNLIIHRDIKPANIRVTSDGEPKLLDFGIAKLLDPETAASGEMTMTFAAVMTPEYASPEQVRGENMTTASDIYSLGVVFYELLTGQRPYSIRSRNPTEVARVVSEQEPARPSTALRGASLQLGEQRDLKSRATLLKGDLDNIALKALRKEPVRRYASVAQFSDDIGRYLEGQPVAARKDTFSYRAVKFVKRNKVAVTAASLVVLAIFSGLIIALRQAEIARRQRDLAQHERSKAERINTFLQQMLSFSNQSITSVSPVAQKRDVTVNEMLDQISPQIEVELSDEPDVRGQVLRTIGSAYASQGRYDLAEKNLRGALDAQVQVHGEETPEAADTMSELGILYMRQGRYDESSSLLEKAVASYRKQRQANASGYSPAKFALALDYLGSTKFYQISPAAAKPLLMEALQVSSSANLQGANRWVLAFNKSDAAGAMIYTGEMQKGENLLREALADYDQISSQPRWERGATLVLLSAVALQKNHPEEAERLLGEGEGIYRQTLGDSNPYLSFVLNVQAELLLRKDRLKDAEQKARESLAMTEATRPNNQLSWTDPMKTLGDVLIKTGRPRDAEGYYRQALAICEKQAKKDYSSIAQLKIQLSKSLTMEDRMSEAERVAVEARDEARRYLGNQSPLAKAATDNLIAIYEKQGKRDLAEALK